MKTLVMTLLAVDVEESIVHLSTLIETICNNIKQDVHVTVHTNLHDVAMIKEHAPFVAADVLSVEESSKELQKLVKCVITGDYEHNTPNVETTIDLGNPIRIFCKYKGE